MVNFLSKLPKTVDQCLKTKYYCPHYLYIMDAQGLIENKNCTLPILFIFCRTVSLNHGEIDNFQEWEFLKISSKTIESWGSKGSWRRRPFSRPYSRFSEIVFLRGKKIYLSGRTNVLPKKIYGRNCGKYLELHSSITGLALESKYDFGAPLSSTRGICSTPLHIFDDGIT